MISVRDIAWMAGLLEGEGCFVTAKRKVKGRLYDRIGISLVMCDEGPVQKAAALFNVNVFSGKTLTKGGKRLYRTFSSGGQAAGWMMTLYPFMSERRRAKIQECLAVWKTMPGKGANQYSQPTLVLMRRGYAIAGGSDNVTANAGAGGATFASDDIGGVQYPRTKIALGAADAYDMDLDSGQQTMANSLPVAIASNQSAIPVTDNSGALTVDNAGTFAVQVDGNALTSLQLIDDPVATLGTTTYTEAATKGMIVGAVRRDADTTLVDTTNEVGPLQMDANGRLKVEVFDGGDSHTVDNGGTFVVQENGSALTALQLIDDVVYTDDTSTHATGTSKGALIMAAATPTDASVNANDIGAVAMTTDRKLHVSVQDALPAGTNAIGKLAANSGVDIGDVDVTSVSGNVTVVQATASNLNAQVVGAVAHDGNTAVNPVQIGLRAETSPKGITLVADGDVTHAYGDADGIQIVKLATSGADLLSERVSNTDGASTAFTNFAAVANTFNYITAITVFRTDSGSSLAYIDFRDGTAGSILYSVPLPPTGGSTLNGGGIPLFKTSANTALAYDVSSALTTVYISVSGYQSKV